MKDKIVQALVNYPGEFLSARELSRILGITRGGVLKHIESLRQEGYIIESRTRHGYKLIHGPVNEYVLSRGLVTAHIGSNFVVRRQVDSTNNLAKELAGSGAAHGTVVVAETQYAGKGRQGRSWVSPAGGIWMSIVLRPQLELKDSARYTILAGTAAAKGLHAAAGIDVGIKWPNDLLFKGKKIGGILTEVQGEWQAVDYLVIGIGINANIMTENLPGGMNASSVLIESAKEIDLVAAIQSILWEMERLEQFMSRGDFPAVLAEWREFAVCLNREVIVKDHRGEWVGESIDISSDGALLIRTEQGELTKIYSADVSLRSKAGDYNFA